MKKILKFLVAFIIVAAVLIGIIIAVTYFNSDKYICESEEGSITIMYRDGKIIGYTGKNIDYDLDGQQKLAEKIGIEEYFSEFKKWFEANTSGTCRYDKE